VDFGKSVDSIDFSSQKSTETLLEGTHRDEDRWICTSLYIYIWNLLVGSTPEKLGVNLDECTLR
jgi:hypothetical protein